MRIISKLELPPPLESASLDCGHCGTVFEFDQDDALSDEAAYDRDDDGKLFAYREYWVRCPTCGYRNQHTVGYPKSSTVQSPKPARSVWDSPNFHVIFGVAVGASLTIMLQIAINLLSQLF